MKTPDPRIVSWTLTGFVVGVILTLLATGALTHGTSSANAVATLPPRVRSAKLPYSNPLGSW